MFDTLFKDLVAAPSDPILSIVEKFRSDLRPEKVNLSVGVYLDESGRTPILDVVKEAKCALAESTVPHAYTPIRGLEGYRTAVQKMVFGADSEVVLSGRAATVQTPGGTGALKVGIDFMRFAMGVTVGATSVPTWGNHNSLLQLAGLEDIRYPYYDAKNHGVDFDAMLGALKALPSNTLVILHACCHNPTGYDLSEAQWKEVLAVCQSNGLIPFLDMAYQGFGKGLSEDAMAVRLFAQSGMSFLVATSYSKSFNLYSERVGALTVVTQSASQAHNVMTQLELVIRSNYSNPPAFGARIVERVLTDPDRCAQWEGELASMRTRIQAMRRAFVDEMVRVGAKRDFSFVTQQAGMFSFTGLTAEQIDRLANEYAIYAVRNGRFCICGLNDRNVKYVAQSVAAVL